MTRATGIDQITERRGCLLQQAQDERSWCQAGLVFLLTAVVLAAAPVIAQEAVTAHEEWTPPSHVRPERGARSLVVEAARRSPSIRAMIDRLEGLDVTVYIRARTFLTTHLEGRIALLSGAAGSHRYLVIELACGRNLFTQMATLAHELFHATEIAGEPSIVDAQTLAAFYARIGTETSVNGGHRTFETQAAADAGLRARRELFIPSTRNARNTHGT
jgi:hypothetical protein